MSSLNNTSKPITSHGRVRLGLTGHGCQAPSSVLEHVTRAGGSWQPRSIRGANGLFNQQSRERQQQSPLRQRFRLTQGCWIQHASSRRSTSRPCRRSLAVPQEVNQSTKSNRSCSTRIESLRFTHYTVLYVHMQNIQARVRSHRGLPRPLSSSIFRHMKSKSDCLFSMNWYDFQVIIFNHNFDVNSSLSIDALQ